MSDESKTESRGQWADEERLVSVTLDAYDTKAFTQE